VADRGRTAWFGVEVLCAGPASVGRVGWFAAEVLVPYYDRSRVAWFGTEVLARAPTPLGRVAWFGVEVLCSGDWYVDGVDVDTVGDDGAVKVTLSGGFPPDQRVKVRVTDGGEVDSLCYSGVIGEAEWASAVTIPGEGDDPDTQELSVWVRPLPIGGPYDLVVTAESGPSFSLLDALTVIKRSFTTNLYSLRSAFPPPRDVGPFRLNDED